MLSAQDSAVDAKLEQRIAFARFDSVVFSSAIEQWSAAAGVKVFVDWAALRTVAVNPSTPVTVTLENVRLSKALQQILGSIPSDAYERKLGYCIDRGRVIITTNRELDSRRVSRTYDVSDLLVGQTSSSGLEQIKRYLTRNVDALSWDDNVDVLSWQDAVEPLNAGGETKQTQVLVVVQLPEVQLKIRDALGALRARINAGR
jgi:hypothetical protein